MSQNAMDRRSLRSDYSNASGDYRTQENQSVPVPSSSSDQNNASYQGVSSGPQVPATYQAQGGVAPRNAIGYNYSNVNYQSPYANRTRVNTGRNAAYQNDSAPNKHGKRGFSPVLCVLWLICGALIGFLATFLIMFRMIGLPDPVASTLTESQLDSTVVGIYSFDDETYSISAREAILASTGLANRINEDGTYQTPSADMVLSCARNAILNKLVEDAGISVTDQNVSDYALSAFGSSDMSTVAAYLGCDDAAQAQDIVSQAAGVKKLRESVVGSLGSSIEPPVAPADGNTEVGNAEYADYIIALLGQYWDNSTGTWASTDNPYYIALSDKVFAPGSANYEAAQAAYSVAVQLQSEATESASSIWTDYVNGYLDEAAIQIATLRA